MKRFIIRTVVFSFLFSAVVLPSNYMINRYYITHTGPRLQGVSILVLGDSHGILGVNPELLPGSANVCQNGEHYIVSYHKLKAFLGENQGIRTVLLSFAYHNLSGFNDRKFSDAFFRYAGFQFRRLYALLNKEDLAALPVSRKAYYLALFRSLLIGIERHPHDKYIGEFWDCPSVIHRTTVDHIINWHFYNGGEPSGISEVAEIYLFAMAELAESYDVELILVTVPLHEEYVPRVPEPTRERFFSARDRLAEMGVCTLEFPDFPMENRYFRDYNHLSGEGAALFTGMLRERLQRRIPAGEGDCGWAETRSFSAVSDSGPR
ncbi:MAG: hypothetical protein GY856_00800 [bacterium]|nr:hypothetical protein [bacterium]